MFSKDFFKSKSFIILATFAAFIICYLFSNIAANGASDQWNNGSLFNFLLSAGFLYEFEVMKWSSLIIGLFFLNLQHYLVKEQSQISSSIMLFINMVVLTFSIGALFVLLNAKLNNSPFVFFFISIGVSVFGFIRSLSLLLSNNKMLAGCMLFLGSCIGVLLVSYVKGLLILQ